MKKVILGILSLLLITPVFSEDIRSVSYNNQISFEEINTNTNITYIQKEQNSIACSSIASVCARTYFGLYDFDNIFSTPASFYISSNTGYGYNVDLTYSFIQLSNDKFNIIDSSRLGGYGVIGINYSGYNYDIDSLQVFYSRPEDANYSGNNPLISFGNNVLTGNYKRLNNNYVRIFYRDNEFNWYNYGTAPGINEEKNIPFNYQIFTLGSSYFNTKNYNVRFPDGNLGTFYAPSISYGFSFINALTGYTWSSLKFYSVFPYFDYEFTGGLVYNLPSWSYTDKFYIFRHDGLRAGSSIYSIGVLSKCNARFCDGTGIYSDLLYSEYYCNGLGFNTGSKKIDFSSCTLINGGVVKNILPFLDSSSVVNVVFTSNNFRNNILDVFNSPSLTYGHNYTFPQAYGWNGFGNFYINNSNQLCYKVDSYNSKKYYNGEYNGCYSIDFTSTIPDILNGFDNTQEPLTEDNIGDILDTLCKSALVKPAFCYNGGVDTISTGLDGMWYVDMSGNLVYTIIGTDSNNLGSFDLVPNGSGGFNVVCTDDLFGCSLVNNVGFSGSSVGGSGYILSPLYYEKFFTETGYWGSCPYPYTDVNVGLRSKVLNKLGDKLGFDIFLPINCTIAAFVHGKNYKFLSDVNLGLNPLMGDIQNSDDPRVYLYRFFDFLLSFALFIFLLKIYHLLN